MPGLLFPVHFAIERPRHDPNVTRHPTSTWIVQQLREAFPYEPGAEFLILDHDAKYGIEVPAAIRSMDIEAVQTAVGCPW